MKISVPFLILGLAATAILGRPRPATADPATADDDPPVFSVPTRTNPDPARTTAPLRVPVPATRPRAVRPESAPVAPLASPRTAPRISPATPPPAIQPSPSTDGPEDDTDVPAGAVRDDAPWMLSTAVTLVHNPAPVGWNRLELVVTDPATGDRVTGLVMHASLSRPTSHAVTTHPAVTETSPGHYTLTLDFPARGDWRVHLYSSDPDKGSVSRTLSINAGARQRWTPPADAAPLEGEAPDLDAQ